MTKESNKKLVELKKEKIKEVLRFSSAVSAEENKIDEATALYQALKKQQSQK